MGDDASRQRGAVERRAQALRALLEAQPDVEMVREPIVDEREGLGWIEVGFTDDEWFTLRLERWNRWKRR